MLPNLKLNAGIAASAIWANKVRSLLTGLGILFGVAAVVAMLAIGAGARKQILEQMRLVGVNNIEIKMKPQDASGGKSGGKEAKSEGSSPQQEGTKKQWSPGLSRADARAIRQVLPGVAAVAEEVVLEESFSAEGRRANGKVHAVGGDYFTVFPYRMALGAPLLLNQQTHADAVCVLGAAVAARLFPGKEAVGHFVKAGPVWLRVVGVHERRQAATGNTKNTTNTLASDDNDLFVPLQTGLLRFTDRSRVTAKSLKSGSGGGFFVFSSGGGSQDKGPTHQLDRLVVQMQESRHLPAASEVLQRLLLRRHNNQPDVEVVVPELLLRQQQQTNEIFNAVLGAIAAISLLVGGIGIMNIMLASVLERLKEIGLRLSIGAKPADIATQFLLEALFISLSGGLLGIALGVSLAEAITRLAGIEAEVTGGAIALAFGVSATVGLLFGVLPARRASRQNPIQSLRYE